MRIRWMMALVALGFTLTPSYAERPKTTTAPDTPEVPVLPTLPALPFLTPPPPSPIMRVQATAAMPPHRFAEAQTSRSMAVQVASTKTAPTATRPCVAKTYPVADLVIPIPSSCKTAGTLGDMLTGATPPATCEKQLIRQLVTHVAPASWQGQGGSGTIEYVPVGMALVINATAEVQEQVKNYLEALRKRLDTQVVLETQIVTLSDAFFTDMKMAKLFELKEKAKAKPVFLQATQLERMLTRFQEDKLTNVMATPKITCFDGQECSLQAGDQLVFTTGLDVSTLGTQVVFVPKTERIETGVKVDFRPQLSADQKHVKLNLKMWSNRLAQTPVPMSAITTPIKPITEDGKILPSVPFTQYIEHPQLVRYELTEEATIPVGQTLMLYGGQAKFTKTTTQKLPLLTDVPVLGALLTKEIVEERTEHVIVLVTPRVITFDGEEASEVPAKPDRLTPLLQEYHAACKAGKTDEARRLALECLTLDPKCFAK